MTVDAAFWDNIAEDYAAQPVDNPESFERKIELTRSLLEPSHTVLNIGCGTGSLALRLAPHAAHIHGLDVSPEMVRIARGKAAAADVGNVHFHVGAFDPTFCALSDASLDGLCAYSILHLLEDRDEALEQVFRLLKPGGFFVASTVCLGESWVPYRPLLAVAKWVGKAPMVKIIRKQTLADEVAAAGFTSLEQPDVGAASTISFIVARKPL